jgi:hypothetical protein
MIEMIRDILASTPAKTRVTMGYLARMLEVGGSDSSKWHRISDLQFRDPGFRLVLAELLALHKAKFLLELKSTIGSMPLSEPIILKSLAEQLGCSRGKLRNPAARGVVDLAFLKTRKYYAQRGCHHVRFPCRHTRHAGSGCLDTRLQRDYEVGL